MAVVARDLETIVPELLARDRIPGMSVALIHDGQVAWEAGFGIVRALTPRPVHSGTVFPAASRGKPAAAYAALRLVSRGDLERDRPIAGGPTYWVEE